MAHSRRGIFGALNLKSHTFNHNKLILPLLDDGLLKYTSQATKSPLQSYVTIEKEDLLPK